MKKLEGVSMQAGDRKLREFTRVRVARYCASQLAWITGKVFRSVVL